MKWIGRSLLVTVLALALAPAGRSTTNASLLLLQPPATFVGNGGYSADGLGQVGTGGAVQADVPTGSTVVQAYLYASYFFNVAPSLADRTIDFDGTDVVLDQLLDATPAPCCELSSARADVTAQVAAKVGGGGIFDFAVNTDPWSMDGVALVVIFENPALPETTIAVLDGGAEHTGDTTTFNFSAPLDKTIAGFSATMSLGIGFGAQDQSGLGGSHLCGEGDDQSSLVDVNGARLTSCAGNLDDGVGPVEAGILITVGGVGDSINNPSDPFQQPADGAAPRAEDDELYNMVPFLSQGDTQLVVETSNPPVNDIVFLSIIAVTAQAVVTTEVCDDGIDNDGDGRVDDDDPDCGPPVEVEIDVKPGSSIKLTNQRAIPVAILTTAGFDATTVDTRTVCFGDAEAPAQRDCSEAHGRGHIGDVDGDGDLDLVLHYETRQTGIDPGDTGACLTGTTFGGTDVEGCDSVRPLA